MRACALGLLLIAGSVACGGGVGAGGAGGDGGQGICPAITCPAAAGYVYLSVTDAATGAVVPDATFLLNGPYGPLTEQSIRVTSIPDGPFAGPCDCYRLLLPAGQSQLVVQAVAFSQALQALDLGHGPPRPPPPGPCPYNCEGPPPGSGALFRIALQKN
jgi:hypothetical protein